MNVNQLAQGTFALHKGWLYSLGLGGGGGGGGGAAERFVYIITYFEIPQILVTPIF